MQELDLTLIPYLQPSKGKRDGVRRGLVGACPPIFPKPSFFLLNTQSFALLEVASCHFHAKIPMDGYPKRRRIAPTAQVQLNTEPFSAACVGTGITTTTQLASATVRQCDGCTAGVRISMTPRQVVRPEFSRSSHLSANLATQF